MARNRVIKPSFWGDDKVGRLKRDVRLLFIGLLNFADDIGVIDGDAKVIRAKIFPYDDLTTKQINDWLKSLVDIGMIVPVHYENKMYYAVSNFSKHQTINRPNTRDTNIPKEILSELIEQYRNIPKLRQQLEKPKKVKEPKNNDCVDKDESYDKFVEWCEDNAPNVLKMAQPITATQLKKLKDDYGVEVICSYLEAMNNWKPLLTKCTNANKTLRNWINRDEQNRIKATGAGTGGVRRGQASISEDYKRSILERMVGASSNEDV